ncbi:ABC transporter substrate-binding protein [Mesobacillus maritimus]|uniref:ABC transporter substrate-binding protein n=1 Tax=Mesobacillus maritimus TaxID=1643336 RepID=UPI00384C8C60
MKTKKRKIWIGLVAFILLVLSACGGGASNSSKVSTEDDGQQTTEGKGKLTLGYATCAHCLPMSLIPDYVENVDVEATNFASGNDVLTALISGSLDVAQVTYLHYITALDKGFDVVAISGQINGGSEILVGNDVPLEENDWDGFKKLIESGEKLKVAASRGNAQDIHMRGEFLLNGIDPVKDVEIINIANPADHASALESGEVDMISTVEPFASQIRLSGVGKHFAYPYEQAAGNLTNLIVTRSEVIEENEEELNDVVSGIVKMVGDLEQDKDLWLKVLSEHTSLSEEVAKEALKNSSPDYKMHQDETLAIAKMMTELNYIQTDVTEKTVENMDYRFLMNATGLSEEELGK